MLTTGDVLHYLDTLAPPYMKMDWDNVGLLCGSRTQPVRKILLALDPFEGATREAADWGADLLVTHHPLLFHPAKAITDETGVGRTIRLLISHNISAINAHTNLDCSPTGVNFVLAQTLGLADIAVIAPQVTPEGEDWGLLRMGLVPEMPLADFLPLVRGRLGCPGLRYAAGGRPVHRVAVGGGACADELADAFAAGCDTFVTADVRYNQFWDAHDLGMNLIDAGHFWTENPVIPALAQRLRAQFPEAEVRVSQTHTDCMRFYC